MRPGPISRLLSNMCLTPAAAGYRAPWAVASVLQLLEKDDLHEMGSQAGMRPRDGINKGSEVGLRTTLDGMRTSPGGGWGPGARGVDVISVEESIAGVNARTGSTAGSVRAEKRGKTRERATRPRARLEARTMPKAKKVEKTRPLAKANMGKPRAKERRAVKAVIGEGEPNGTGQKQKGSPT